MNIFGFIFLLAASVTSAEVKVVVDHNDPDNSSPEFKFVTVPSPSQTNAASHAKFSIIDGRKSPLSGELDVLHDGNLPSGDDNPTRSFFFIKGSIGGAIRVDLGSVIDVKQINTYSWHAAARAPQVYSVYGSNGQTGKFNASPATVVDPTTCGWGLVANVDTRPKTGNVGGQYGVSIFNTAGILGKYRYLLLRISCAELKDDFGNTFFSQINVIDANELIANPTTMAARSGIKRISMEQGKYTATINTIETPDLTDWADQQLAPVVNEWYPKLVKMLPGKNFSAPTHFSITFRAQKKGVADTSGTRINCAATWFRSNLKGEAKGAIVHEMVHIVQQYGLAYRTNPHADQPSWLVEGIPDYIRWYKFEADLHEAAIGKGGFEKARYDGMYRVSANFLNYVVQKYDKDLIQKLNTAMRTGDYSDNLWPKLTRKSITDLNAEWKADLATRLKITGPTTN